MKRKLTALSLFSGAGGLDLGASWAGFEILAHVEIDPHCCATLRSWAKRERSRTRIVEADINTINPTTLMSDLHLEAGDLDLLMGGPPCQAFSQIGLQKSLHDPRGLLLFQMARFAKTFKPKTILIEQVKGVLTAEDQRGQRGGVLKQLLADLRSCGYESNYQVLKAADYGVPQLRERVFVIATPPPNTYVFPLPTHSPNKEIADLFAAKPYATVGQALAGLPKPPIINGRKSPLKTPNHADVTTQRDRERINGVPEGGWLSAQLHLSVEQRRRLTRKDTTKYRRLARSGQSLTLRCGEIFFHPTQNRYLTPREYLRLHGYPDTFILEGPIRSRSGRVRHLDQHRQVANSVPPPLAKILAERVKENLSCHNSSKSLAIH